MGQNPRVLVLGPRIIAEGIADRLAQEGFDPSLEAEYGSLPRFASDPQGISRLRTLLEAFAADRTGPGLRCVHPGVSLWAERPELATLSQELGLTPICPPIRVLNLFSNKLNLLAAAERIGVPTLLLNPEPMHSLREVQKLVASNDLKLPFILKGIRGGGGFGLHPFKEPEEIDKKLPLWLGQMRELMGEVILFAERYLEGARHLSVPFARMSDGKIRFFALTDGSLQCRNRKVVELAPASGIDPLIAQQLEIWAAKVAENCGFVGVGVLEFLVDGPRAFLIDGVARLNTGFELWEAVTGTRAVAWQLACMGLRSPIAGASGPEAPADSAAPPAAGMLLRFHAEDSILMLPQPGAVHEVSERRRWDLGGAVAQLRLAVEPGMEVAPSGHGQIGSLLVLASDRKIVSTVARGVLDEIWIAGALQTNERFLSELLAHPWVREGMYHAAFIDEEFLPIFNPPAELVKLFVSVCEGALIPGTEVRRWVVGDQWAQPDPEALHWEEGPTYFDVPGATRARGVSGRLLGEDGRKVRVCAYPLAGADTPRWQVRIGHWVLSVRVVPKVVGTRKPVPSPRVLALVNGRVHSILFREGALVPAHEPLVTVESLGMLIPHALPMDVRVGRWSVHAEDKVRAGQMLAELETLNHEV